VCVCACVCVRVCVRVFFQDYIFAFPNGLKQVWREHGSVNAPSRCRRPRLTNFPFTDSFRGENYVNKVGMGLFTNPHGVTFSSTVVETSGLASQVISIIWKLQVLRRKLFP